MLEMCWPETTQHPYDKRIPICVRPSTSGLEACCTLKQYTSPKRRGCTGLPGPAAQVAAAAATAWPQRAECSSAPRASEATRPTSQLARGSRSQCVAVGAGSNFGWGRMKLRLGQDKLRIKLRPGCALRLGQDQTSAGLCSCLDTWLKVAERGSWVWVTGWPCSVGGAAMGRAAMGSAAMGSAAMGRAVMGCAVGSNAAMTWQPACVLTKQLHARMRADGAPPCLHAC
eukprot:351841-Chlamydomonas_euryale.AAC.4